MQKLVLMDDLRPVGTKCRVPQGKLTIRYRGLIETFFELLDAKTLSGKIGSATRRTYVNNLSRILEAFVKTHAEDEILELVRSSTSNSKTNAETLRVIRILKWITRQMPRKGSGYDAEVPQD